MVEMYVIIGMLSIIILIAIVGQLRIKYINKEIEYSERVQHYFELGYSLIEAENFADVDCKG